MGLGYVTIVTPIWPDKADHLDALLRERIATAPTATARLQCQPLFPFDQLMGLHLCSFLIIREADGTDPRLVFEATFDGPREEFLHDLLRVAREGVHAIYENCVGYPKTGMVLPELVKDYLRLHDAGSNAFFTGSPGRSVMQIRGEQAIRDQVATHLVRRNASADGPTTYRGLQRELQHEVIRAEPANHWAEQPAPVPFEVTQRATIATAVVVGAGLVALILGVLVLGAFGYGFNGTRAVVAGLVADVMAFGETMVARLVGDGAVLRPFVLILTPLAPLVPVWLGLRFVQFALQREDPRQTHFWIRFVAHVAIVLRYAVLAFIIGAAVLTFEQLMGNLPKAPGRLATLGLLVGVAIALLVLNYWATSLKLAVAFRELAPAAENGRRLLLDLIRFGMAILGIWTLAVLALHIPAAVALQFAAYVFAFARLALVGAIYVVVGVLVVYALGFILFNVIRLLEWRDRRRFAPAGALIARPLDWSTFEREEGGVHRYQNHLASVTHVKPGWLRKQLLRATLFGIHLLARFKFNSGELGGIPTILAARWTLIDNGRRLLFFSNYGGAWNSYLNEFIDMGAVIGLNAVWNNTFLERRGARYAFPETSYYLWRGAENERQFKSYVRHSQVETLVWYSAYPTVSIININNNTALRQALFQPLKPHELDAVFLKAGL